MSRFKKFYQGVFFKNEYKCIILRIQAKKHIFKQKFNILFLNHDLMRFKKTNISID